MVLSLHKQPFVTAHFQFITAHFVRHCALKNALQWLTCLKCYPVMMYIISQWTDCNTGITVSDSKHSEYELDVSMPLTRVSSLLLFGFGTIIVGWCRYFPFHRCIDVSTVGHFGDLDVNLETFILLLSARSSTFFICLWNLDFRLLPALHAHLPCTT